MIPNLVASTSKIMGHEKDLFSKITTLRTMCGDAKNDLDKFALNNELSRFLCSIKAALENYPQIKSNENILSLQHSLDDIQKQISAVRRACNFAVMVYNNACEMFLTNIIANLFNFQKKEFLKKTKYKIKYKPKRSFQMSLYKLLINRQDIAAVKKSDEK
ncbi:LemA family protein [Campylobacter sp. RM12327]|nr:LemA family protein [Campylobacter sp. RM11302]MBF6670006.1 LemA family protein [Campylobacter sp. RM12327]MBF6674226.1 LemA family protein [Campylobacter sp. RM13538]MBF6676651.1 LemA family protein [Campylobacter sp. RM12321]MBF6678405.1 LemA family protein [Campylobacter sp. RM11259]